METSQLSKCINELLKTKGEIILKNSDDVTAFTETVYKLHSEINKPESKQKPKKTTIIKKKSGYNSFMQHFSQKHKEIVKLHPEKAISQKEFLGLVGKEWRTLSDEEKNEWSRKANEPTGKKVEKAGEKSKKIINEKNPKRKNTKIKTDTEIVVEVQPNVKNIVTKQTESHINEIVEPLDINDEIDPFFSDSESVEFVNLDDYIDEHV